MSKLKELIDELCPNGVEWKKLGEVGKFYGGLTGKSKNDFVDGNAKFITYMNVYSNYSINTNINTLVKINEGEKQNIVMYGDVLFTGSSETPDECGMSSVMADYTSEPYYLNSFCFGFRFDNPSLFLPGFTKYLFRDTKIRKEISKTASGVTRYNVSKTRFAKIEIPLPPLPVQEEIVRILDHFTNLAAELQAELQARQEQYEYYRNKLLSFNDIGGGIQVEWKKMSEVGDVCMCKRIMKNQTSPSGDIPFFKIGTFGGYPDAYISKELFEEYKQKYSYPNKGDLLISASGTIGRVVVFDGKPAYFQDSNIVWVSNDEKLVLNCYLFHLYKIIKWKTDGGTIKRLYNSNIQNTIIPIPPLAEQKRIADILDRFEKLTTDLSEGLPAEIAAVQEQYEYYRNKLLTF